MTNEMNQALVLHDDQGNYYRISREVLAACRVPEAEKASLEETLGADTGGYYLAFTLPPWALANHPPSLAHIGAGTSVLGQPRSDAMIMPNHTKNLGPR